MGASDAGHIGLHSTDLCGSTAAIGHTLYLDAASVAVKQQVFHALD
jgi:hypothetical protein